MERVQYSTLHIHNVVQNVWGRKLQRRNAAKIYPLCVAVPATNGHLAKKLGVLVTEVQST